MKRTNDQHKTADTKASDTLSEFDNLYGIDAQTGLQYCVGRSALYRKQLQRFRDSGAGFPEQFARARASGDKPEMLRLAHTLKSNAALIGAERLSEAFRQLELSCIDSATTALNIQLPAGLTAELDGVLQGLQQLSDDS